VVEKGCENMVHMINVIRKAGINPVVCINRFYTDTDAECAIVRKAAEAAGARCAESKHWEKGGEGALEFADAVIDACNEGKRLQIPLSAGDEAARPRRTHRQGSLRRRRCGLGSRGRSQGQDAGKRFQVRRLRHHDGQDIMSLSHDPTIKGVPKGWTLPIRDVLIYSGAKFLCPCAGTISLMPGTGSNPAYRRVDVDPETRIGKVIPGPCSKSKSASPPTPVWTKTASWHPFTMPGKWSAR
jgi:formate--tetrahydrofolate ligase